MYELVILTTVAIIFLIGWNCNDLYRQYEAKKKEEYTNIVNMYTGGSVNE